MSKLISALQGLSISEFKKFSRYIHSPYFCQHKPTQQMFDLLEEHFPEFDLDLEDSFHEVYSEDLSKTDFKLIKSYLLRHVYDFLAFENFQGKSSEAIIHMANALREKGEFREAEKKIKIVEKRLEKEEWNEIYFEQLYKVKSLQLDLQLHADMISNQKKVNSLIDALDSGYLFRLLKYHLTEITYAKLLGHINTPLHWAKIRYLIGDQLERFHPMIKIYFSLNEAIIQANLNSARTAYSVLEEHHESIGIVEKINIFGYLQNFWTRQYGLGEKQALQVLITIYQEMAAQDLILGRGEITEHFVRNITIFFCRAGEQNWAKEYFEKYREKLEREVGMKVYSFSLAYFHFYERDFRKALKFLQLLEFKDQYYRTAHQVLMLRIYYELGEFELLDSLSRTFRRYLNRAKDISEEKKQFNRNFLSILTLLSREKENQKGATDIAKISGLLDEMKGITDPTWLKEKLGELRAV